MVLLQGGRELWKYGLGNELWHFSLGALGTADSSEGRFTALFSSNDSPTITMEDYRKFSSVSFGVTAISVSSNTATTSASMVTGSGTGTGTSSSTLLTTVYTKNGQPWASSNSSNTATETLTLDLGDVSASGTTFCHTVQQTGYSFGSLPQWTSGTITTTAPASSRTTTRNSLYSSVSLSVIGNSRFSTTVENLVSIYSYDADASSGRYVGLSKTTTTRVFFGLTTLSQSHWESNFNSEITIGSTSSTRHITVISDFDTGTGVSTGTATIGTAGTTYDESASVDLTLVSEHRLGLATRSNHFSNPFGASPVRNEVWHSSPAVGYGGFGGNFTVSDLPVYLGVTMGIVEGGEFPGQTFSTSYLSSALAYDQVTFFPAISANSIISSASLTFKYLTGLSELGDEASIAATWSTTTATTGGATIATTKGATYTLSGATAIEGTFYRSEAVTFNTSDPRGGFNAIFTGGYAAGDNAMDGAQYTVRLNSGYAAWTLFTGDDSTGTGSTSGTDGSISFTLDGSEGIVLSAEPIISVSWATGVDDKHYSSSTPHFPFGSMSPVYFTP